MKDNKTTREKILDAALTLFSQKGFDGVGVDEMAETAGVKGPAIYHYFKGKDAVLMGLVEAIEEHYDKNFGIAEGMTRVPENMQQLIEMSKAQINFTIHDEQIKKIRRFITTEQFRNDKLRALATSHFLDGIEAMYIKIFEGMIDNGAIKPFDASLLAMEFTAPVTQMIHLIDREPEREAYATARIEKHFEHFAMMYGN